METFYIVYKTTNKINGKFYIGIHKTNNLNDNYMGSGKLIKLAINKYGIENFEREILYVYDNPDDMFIKEAEIVNDEFLMEENTYNLTIGGGGGFEYCNTHITEEQKQKRAVNGRKKADEMLKKQYGDNFVSILSKKGQDKLKDIIRENPDFLKGRRNGFLGKNHSIETKDKMSKIAKKRLMDPTKNPSYGKCWIHNDSERIMVFKDEML